MKDEIYKKINKLELKRDEIDKEIKLIKRNFSLKTTYKDVKSYVGNFYKFRNSYSNSYNDFWYIYGFCKDRIIDGETVYLIFDEYEYITVNKETIIKINHKHIMNDSWNRGWDYIKKEEFEENKKRIISKLYPLSLQRDKKKRL